MHGLHLNALCLALFGTVALAGETAPLPSQANDPGGFQTPGTSPSYYPQQRYGTPRYRPMETRPSPPMQQPYGEYPASRGTMHYAYPETYPQQEYYPASPSMGYPDGGYYPATPEYGQYYSGTEAYGYPYVYQQAPDYGSYYQGQPGYDYGYQQPAYPERGYYEQPTPAPGYGDPYTPQGYDYQPGYPPGDYPAQQSPAPNYPPATGAPWEAPPGESYQAPTVAAPQSRPGSVTLSNPGMESAPTTGAPWRETGQPATPSGQGSGYLVNGEPAIFRPWSEPTIETQPPAQNYGNTTE